MGETSEFFVKKGGLPAGLRAVSGDLRKGRGKRSGRSRGGIRQTNLKRRIKKMNPNARKKKSELVRRKG